MQASASRSMNAAIRLQRYKAHLSPTFSANRIRPHTNTPSLALHRRPMATQSDKPVVLYTQGTPNGISASVYLEELKERYGGPDYE